MYKVDLTPISVPGRFERVHTVQPGETAKTIAMHYFHNPKMANYVLMHNGGVITAGQVIRIP